MNFIKAVKFFFVLTFLSIFFAGLSMISMPKVAFGCIIFAGINLILAYGTSILAILVERGEV